MLAVFSAQGFEQRYDRMAALPGTSLGAPSGMTSSWGSYFLALGGLTNTPTSNRTDGSFAMGMGLGDPLKDFGSTISLSIGSVNPDGNAGERGSFGVSVGKFFVDQQLGVAVGAINVAGWNDVTTKPKSSIYVAVTKIIPIDEHPIIINAGFGTNAFADVQELNPEDETGIFLSAAVYLNPHVSFIVDSTSAVLSVGTSITPISYIPLVITLGAFDINKDVPNHDSVSFTGSVAYSLMFK